MRRGLALRVLGDIMGWPDERATDEFRWLDLISRIKYDGYQDYLAGARFLESLASWLQQFGSVEEREIAYRFVLNVLIYIGPAELQGLIELFYPVNVERRIVHAVAESTAVPPYKVWANADTVRAFETLLRRTIFLGLSEGAHLDRFRRANAGTISHEQVLVAPHVGTDKWKRVLAELRADLQDQGATFRFLYLIDDFTASGTTFIRRKDDGSWKGKLAAFHQEFTTVKATHFDPALTVCVHHYIGTARAQAEVRRRHEQALADRGAKEWFGDVEFSYGAILPDNIALNVSTLPDARAFLSLAIGYCDAEHPQFHTPHFEEGGTKDPALGFADCGLPLALEHNTPNDSIAILWAETRGNCRDGEAGTRPAMRPLFRRRQRHT
jgi:hypothetical protein